MKLWNGNRAALSLTFDDFLPSQYQYAVPALRAKGVRATFFPICNSGFWPEFPKVELTEVVKDGHEIGSHSVNHFKLADLTLEQMDYEAGESKRIIERALPVRVTSYCYPYTDANEDMIKAVQKYYSQARSGRVAARDKYMRPKDFKNLHYTPAVHVGPSFMHNNELPYVINHALLRGAWVVLMLHGVGCETDWDNISTEQFLGLLETLELGARAGLWVAPFGEVAQSFRDNS